MWTTENRCRYDRSGLRYPSDLTDDEWDLLRLLIPPAKRGGNKRMADVREIVNGLMYILGIGCQWAAVPNDLPPRSTVNRHFKRWQYDRALDRLHHAAEPTGAFRWRRDTIHRHRHRQSRLLDGFVTVNLTSVR